MNRTILIFVVIVIVVGALFWYMELGQFTIINSKVNHIIELREDGYHPKELTIQKGDTVKFVSMKQDGYFWPASNLHPSHTVYPEFDSKEPVAAKDSWTFTFKRIGSWRYHDHLSPYFTGVVNVIEI